MTQKLDHKHLLIKAFVTNPPRDEQLIIEWFKDLVDKVGMKVVIGPHAKYVTTPGNEGPTGMVCIETSHSSMHVWSEEEKPYLQMDLYSCSTFKPSQVIEKLEEFGLLNYEYMFIDRNDSFKVIEHTTVNKGIDNGN